MATSTLSDIINALPTQFHEKLTRVWNRSCTTVSLLDVKAGAGKNCTFDVNVGGASAASYAEGADVVAGELLNDSIVPASLDWGFYRTGFAMTDAQIDAAASSVGAPSAVMNIFQERALDSITALLSKINQDCISGDGTDGSSNPTIVGFLGGALPTTGETYAGLAVGSYSSWAASVIANGGVSRPLSVDLLNQGDKNQFVSAGTRADLIISDAGSYQKYAGLFEAMRRVNGDGSKASYGTGASALEFMGTPVERDKDMTAGNLLMLDRKFVELRYLPYTEDSMKSAKSAVIMVGFGSNGDDERQGGLPIRCYALPKAGDSTKFVFECRVQLVVRRPNAQVWIKDIATT